MLRKLWNTLRFGDAHTKRFLIGVGALGILSIGFLITAMVTFSPLFWLGTVVTVLLTVALAKDAKLAVIKDNKERESMSEEELREEQARKAEEKKRKKESGKRKNSAGAVQETAEVREEREKEDAREFDGDALANMTEEKLKRLFVRYKVKQEHVPVVIDLCVPEHVKQAPGFAWVEGGRLKILIIEDAPRMIERPLSALQVMEVERGISVRASNEYAKLRDTDWMKKYFTPYLPRYQKKEVGGRTVLLKNLYVLDGELKFSSPSVRELKTLFSFRIEMADRRLSEESFSPCYKALFTSSVLWKDGILNLKEYQQEVEQVLLSLAAQDISYQEFDNTLSAVINAGLLPAQYREFAHRKREERINPVPDGKEKKKKRNKQK